MKITHLISTLAYGDAMGMYTIALSELCKQEQNRSHIVAHHIAENATNYGEIFNPGIDVSEDVLTYQMGASDPTLSNFFIESKAKKKVLFYHNITPGKYFREYQRSLVMEQLMAREELSDVALHADLCIAMSDYSAKELKEIGAKKVVAIPLLVSGSPYAKEDKEVSKQLEEMHKNGKKIILFYGRRVPHKGHKDILKTIAAYKLLFPQENLHVALIGSPAFDIYDKELETMITDLKLTEEVSLLGKVPYPVLSSYLKHSDVFLSMSEHEGFFMPVIECMQHQIPILAYASSAVPYTVGDGGVLFTEKDYGKVAYLLHEELHQEQLREEIVKSQKEQLKNFDSKKVGGELMRVLMLDPGSSPG